MDHRRNRSANSSFGFEALRPLLPVFLTYVLSFINLHPARLLHDDVATAIDVAVALIWLVPDRRIESRVER